MKNKSRKPFPERLSALVLARQKEFESPTFRLGGGRSILLSYWRMYNEHILADFHSGVKEKPLKSVGQNAIFHFTESAFSAIIN